MLNRFLKAFFIHLGISFLLFIPAYLLLVNQAGFAAFACMIFGPIIAAAIYQWRPWTQEKAPFGVLFFVIHSVALMMILILLAGPMGSAKLTEKYLGNLPEYNPISDKELILNSDSGRVKDPNKIFRTSDQFEFIHDSTDQLTIAYQPVYEDSLNKVYMVFAGPGKDREKLRLNALEAIEKNKEEVIILPNPEKRKWLNQALESDQKLQFIQWQTPASIINDYQKAIYSKALISFAILLLLGWYSQKSETNLN